MDVHTVQFGLEQSQLLQFAIGTDNKKVRHTIPTSNSCIMDYVALMTC